MAKNKVGRPMIENACDNSKRERARRWYTIDMCEMCGKKAIDRHHIDGDCGNNVRGNLMFLCRKCHMDVDGRLARLPSRYTPPVVPLKPCVNCKTPSKPLRKGLCHACNEYKRRNNTDRPQFVPGTKFTERTCNTATRLRVHGLRYSDIGAILGITRASASKLCRMNPSKPCHKDVHKK